jgi:hypothetical protein
MHGAKSLTTEKIADRAEPMQGLGDDDLRELAYSAHEEAMSLGLSHETFLRYFKTIRGRAVEASRQRPAAQAASAEPDAYKKSWLPVVLWWERGGKDWDGLRDAICAMLNAATPTGERPASPAVNTGHLCGLQGFGAPGDECPACTADRARWDASPRKESVRVVERPAAPAQAAVTDEQIDELWYRYQALDDGPSCLPNHRGFARALLALGMTPSVKDSLTAQTDGGKSNG